MKPEEMKESIRKNIRFFLKWGLISTVIGVVVGTVGALFGRGITLVTDFGRVHSWTLYLLPVAGLVIVWLYHISGEDKNKGTDTVMEAISSNEEITVATAPLIFISTILTQLCAGSAGREGAALQLGGSLGNTFGHLIHLDEKDRKIAVMCGMSAAFSALFGTPLAAAIFSMEVVSIGVLYYAALVPCVFASFLGAAVSRLLGNHAEAFAIGSVPEFTLASGGMIILLGMLCAAVSCLFCMVLHKSHQLYTKYFPNPYLRVFAGGCLLILLTMLVGNRDYNGGGISLIERFMEGEVRYGAFLLKMIFTGVTLGAGYKGGEIVPTLCVGAAFGSLFGSLTGFAPPLCAACGMAALFVGVTNCPISTLLIAFELFGYEAMPFFALSIAVSFTLSGYYGLYSSQKFVYSKTKTEFINRRTRK